MSFRFKDQGPNDSKFDDRDRDRNRDRDRDRMLPIDDKLSRDDIDGNRGSRAPFGRGRRPSPSPRDKSMSDRRDFDRYGRDESGRDRSPRRLDDRRLDDRDRDRFRRDEPPFPRRDERDREHRDREHRDRPLDDEIFRDKFMGRIDDRARFDGPPGLDPRFDLPDDPLRPLGYPGSFKGFFKNDVMKPNECEIIVVNKQQRAYAESVETRLKNLGIQVDLLFLKDEALLVQTIDDIARRGSFYAIVISPLNETHRSVTLNILCGTPQEHRNMPLDDALKLIARNFHDHVRTQREIMDKDKSERGMFPGYFPADREIQFLLRILADGRQLSLGEIETVIRYLTERRDKMKGASSNAGAPTSAPSEAENKGPQNAKKEEDLAQKEKELQNRIMHIMEESSSDATKQPVGNAPGLGPDIRKNDPGLGPIVSGIGPVPASSLSQNQGVPGIVSQAGSNASSSGANMTSTTPTYINFDNPSVQKALDSLMQSGPNLLKSLASTTASPSQSVQSIASTEQSVMGSDMGMSRGIGDMVGLQRGRLGNMNDMGLQRGPGGMGDMGQQRGGLGGMSNMGAQRGQGDMGQQRGLGGMGGDMGQQRGPGGMGGDMGQQRGTGGLGSDMGQQRGPGGMGGDMGQQRSLGGMGGDIGQQRGLSGMGGDMGQQRGPGGMMDMGMRGLGNQMGDMGMRGALGDMGYKHGPGGISDMGPRSLSGMDERGQDSMGNQRGVGGNMSKNMQRGLSGLNEGGMGLGMGSMQDANNMGMSGFSNMSGLGPRGMGPSSQFQGSQSMFSGNSPNMMGSRPPFMSGRRY